VDFESVADMKTSLLRTLLLLDAVVLAVLGVLFIFMPHRVATYFHFTDLPQSVGYLIGLWGCVMLSLAAAYAIVSRDPIQHRLWIDIAIVRALLEAILGAVYIARGTVNFSQAGFGIVVAAALALAYVILYPRTPALTRVAEVPAPAR
jgi:hypothetical protein